MVAGGAVDTLSDRQRQILALVAQGKTNRQIAKALGLSQQTIKNGVTVILLKMGVKNRTQAALKFHGLKKR